jgi:hypothetical protein
MSGQDSRDSDGGGRPAPSPGGSPTLTFRGGGWVIVLAGVLVVLLLAWSFLGPLLGRHPIGDGRTVESYGFDLSNLRIDRADLVASGNPRGFLPSLDDPKHIRGSEMVVYNERNRPKYVVSTDRIVGVVIEGQPHAWPLSMLNVHEVVNDTVAGVPVAMTYSPLCDSAVAFDRRIGGRVRTFEVSGLLVDSNLVFYDKAPSGTLSADHSPTLFLQLARRAIAGPLATTDEPLRSFPGVTITTWSDWLTAHPDTTVTERDPQTIRRMKEISYARYFLSPGLEFPSPRAPSDSQLSKDGMRLKSPVVLCRLGDAWHALPVERLVEQLASDGGSDRMLRRTVGGVELEVHLPAGPAVARVARADGEPLETVPCLWFSASLVRPSAAASPPALFSN